MYEIAELKDLVNKAKITRNISFLEEIHMSVLEYLRILQERHEKNIKAHNYSLKSQLEKIEDLNLAIYTIFAKLSTLDSKST